LPQIEGAVRPAVVLVVLVVLVVPVVTVVVVVRRERAARFGVEDPHAAMTSARPTIVAAALRRIGSH